MENVTEMFNDISQGYDRANRLLSFGQDELWRKRLIKAMPQKEEVALLDLATGTCDQLMAFLKAYPHSSAVGLDPAEAMLKVGQAKLEREGLKNRANLVTGSALEIPFLESTFDCVSMSFGIRNVGSPLDCLKEIERVLKPRGVVLILEFSLPHKFLRWPYLLYLRHLLPLLGGLVTKNAKAYRYLNRTIEAFPYGEAFLDLMREANLVNVKATALTLGVVTLYRGEKG